MLKRLKASIYSAVARRYLRAREFERAAAWLSEVIRLVPNKAAAHVDRGYACQGMNDHRRAIDHFERAIGLDSHLALAYYNRGISWKALGDFDRAVADQAQARALAPRGAVPLGELGALAQIKGDFDASIDHLNLAIKLAPTDAMHYRSRGCTRFFRGEMTAAETDLRYSINLADDPYALLFWYLASARIGHDASRELESRAKRLRGRRWPAPIIDLYLGKIGTDAALAAATSSVERGEAEFYVGEWHLLHGNHAHAATALRAAAEACPAHFIEHTAAVVELTRLE